MDLTTWTQVLALPGMEVVAAGLAPADALPGVETLGSSACAATPNAPTRRKRTDLRTSRERRMCHLLSHVITMT